MPDRLWRGSLAPPSVLRQHLKGTRLRAVPPTGASGGRVYDDPAADPNPHAPSGPRPVASKLLTRASTPPTPSSSLGDEAVGAFERSPSVSGEPVVCPYLRAIDDQDRLLPPVLSPDPVNRCAAMGEAVPQSLRQQELVCLTSGHL